MSDDTARKKKTYLGDGLYARLEYDMIILETPRDDFLHWVALEPEVFEQLLQFAMNNGLLKKGEPLK